MRLHLARGISLDNILKISGLQAEVALKEPEPLMKKSWSSCLFRVQSGTR